MRPAADCLGVHGQLQCQRLWAAGWLHRPGRIAGQGYNSNGYVEQLPINLIIEGHVVTSTNVPEPDTLSLMLLGSGVPIGSNMLRRRREQQGKNKC